MAVLGTPTPVTTLPWKERFEGMIPNLVNKTLRYCSDENTASEPIPLGSVVCFDSAKVNGVKVATKADDVIRGIAVFNMQRVYDSDASGRLIYRKGDPVTILEDGDVIMYAEADTTSGKQVFFRGAVDAQKTHLSAIAVATGTGLFPLLGARTLETVKAGELIWVQYRITLPAPAASP